MRSARSLKSRDPRPLAPKTDDTRCGIKPQVEPVPALSHTDGQTVGKLPLPAATRRSSLLNSPEAARLISAYGFGLM